MKKKKRQQENVFADLFTAERNNYVLIRCAQTNVNYFLLKYYRNTTPKDDGWMLRQSKLTFINTFVERMCHNSYNPELSVIAKRLDTSSRTYMSLAQSDFQLSCNLGKRSDKLVLLLTTAEYWTNYTILKT